MEGSNCIYNGEVVDLLANTMQNIALIPPNNALFATRKCTQVETG